MENNLKFEKSLYLVRHSQNPVFWQSWTERSIELARQKNKPIFLSIGYSACHWCRVMEKESFEDTEIAEIINNNFIPIKMDKDEFPDIDKEYQFYLQSTGENGGWPLNVFLTPNLEPFYAGTYFPKVAGKGQPSFKMVLDNICKIWNETPDEIQKVIDTRKDFLDKFNTLQEKQLPDELLAKYRKTEFTKIFDTIYYGFREGAKFPYIPALNYLIDHIDEQEYTDFLIKTADKLCTSAINDHLFGGFFRYTVDRMWQIPHFEKMLIDNTLIISFLIKMYEKTENRLYSYTAQKAIDFILYGSMRTDYGYLESIDADSLNHDGSYEEGFYYKVTDRDFTVLSEKELKNFPNEASVINGIIQLKHNEYIKAVALEPTIQKVAKRIESVRTAPECDNKAIAGSNFQLCTALLNHYEVMGESYDLEQALALYHKLRHLLVDGSSVFHGIYAMEEEINRQILASRSENPEEETIHEYIINHKVLSDHVYYLEATLKFYEITSEKEFLNIAKGIIKEIDTTFTKDGIPHLDIHHRVKDTFDDDKINPIGLYLYLLLKYKDSLCIEPDERLITLAEDRAVRFPTGHPTIIKALELIGR